MSQASFEAAPSDPRRPPEASGVRAGSSPAEPMIRGPASFGACSMVETNMLSRAPATICLQRPNGERSRRTDAGRSPLVLRVLAGLLALALTCGAGPSLAADESVAPEAAPGQDESQASDVTPPRLSFTDGEVSFWRPGAADWAPARINTPLAPGDNLYTSTAANLELQIASRAFVRAGELTQLGFENQEPDFLQFKITAGHVSLDIRGLTSGHTIELDTPNAAFNIDHIGYYRLDVSEDTTTFITRRGGAAMMAPPDGEATAVAPSEEVVVQGNETPNVSTYAAPDVDDWDRWNYDRTDHLLDAVSARYVPPGVYGTDALDYYGNWRVVPPYGPVWVPDGVAADWAPYSTGSWMWDPYYSWTWVDVAPWGWAPYHYGRWVFINGFWAWAPGPVVVRPYYAPALVAFFGPSVGVSVGFGFPVGWVALGWGEPFIPWWVRVGFIGRPCWHGWGGPHVVNNVVVDRTTIVNVKNINVYRNAEVHNALVVERRDHFGHGLVASGRVAQADVHHFEPIHGQLPITPARESLVPETGRAIRPPAAALDRQVVATRAPRDMATALRNEGLKPSSAFNAPAPRMVAAPHRPNAPLSRPPFGQQGNERQRPPLPPRFDRGQGGAPRMESPSRGPREASPPEIQQQPSRELPGEPANRVFRGRSGPVPGGRQAQPLSRPGGRGRFAPGGFGRGGRSGGGSARH